MAEKSPGAASDYLAAERTFLAWIRTGLALMGFGFVVARFGIFLQALRAGKTDLEARSYGLSFWFGTALVILGVAVNAASAYNHIRLVQQLNRGELPFTRPSWLAVAVAVLLALVGMAMAVYLILVREPS
jgi:putative membrane protein